MCELAWQASQGEDSPMPSVAGRAEVIEIGSISFRDRGKEEWGVERCKYLFSLSGREKETKESLGDAGLYAKN